MPNPYFQFKQFVVYQQKCAMKVCTDACIFGSYISLKEKNGSNNETNILDIGTGTGLLSLMIAQKVKGNIEAVEIDEKAFEQSQENFINSAWRSRLSVYHGDIKRLTFTKKYHLIVSNPPFFEKSLKSSDYQKNFAKHTTSLSYSELAAIASGNLMEKGKFYILLPFNEFKVFANIATRNRLSLIEKIHIRQNEHSPCLRTIGVFIKAPGEAAPIEELINIKDNKGYTASFTKLLNDYYLYL